MAASARFLAVVAVGVLCVAFAGCNLLGNVPDTGRRFAVCADEAGAAAWERAQQAMSIGDDARALPDLKLACDRCPEFVRAHLAWQDAARRLGGEAEAEMVRHFTAPAAAPVADSPVPDYLRLRLAETAYAQNNGLEQILRRHPGFGWAHLSLARVHRSQGRLLAAADSYAAAFANDSFLAEARLERAQVLVELGRDEEAAVDFKAYLQVEPGDRPAQHQYAELLIYRLNRIDEALDVLQLIETLGGSSDALVMHRAAAMWRARRPREAANGYLEVLRRSPDNARAALNLGLLYYEVAPKDDAERRRFWPRARIAFEWFLARSEAADGHEQFERTWGVPYRLRRIREVLGPSVVGASAAGSSAVGEFDAAALAWPEPTG
jgi:tetratricopeptide (TPR) repeat protein